MEQAGQGDLFEIKLTDTAKNYINKFAAVARIAIIIGLFISFIHICSTVLRYISFHPVLYKKYSYLVLEHQLLPYYTTFFCLLFYPQMYLYWQVTKYLKKGLKYENEELFNKAFNSLYRYAILGLILSLLSLLSYGFELFVFIKYFMNWDANSSTVTAVE